MSKTIVVALGGNAILQSNQRGTAHEQQQNLAQALRNLIPFIRRGDRLAITHGNGPQVGNLLMQQDAGAKAYDIPPLPLDVCVAETQGSIGYMITCTLRNLLLSEDADRQVVPLVTEIIVDKQDPAFQNPTKRVGRLYDREMADRLTAEKGWTFKPSPKKQGAWRRVVPSPRPVEIPSAGIVRRLLNQNTIVVTAGGGGVPVYRDDSGICHGVEAVIDKDAASALLASAIGADELYILTDVPAVYLNFGKPEQEVIEQLTPAEARAFISRGAFGEGNMLPKIQAAVSFVSNGGHKAIITNFARLNQPGAGTQIVNP